MLLHVCCRDIKIWLGISFIEECRQQPNRQQRTSANVHFNAHLPYLISMTRSGMVGRVVHLHVYAGGL